MTTTTTARSPRPCRDCGAKPGALHTHGCDVERCSLCGAQAIGCDCVYELNHMHESDLEEEHPDIYEEGPTKEMYATLDAAVEAAGGRLPWTGEYPGLAECREFDFWCYFGPDYGLTGWQRCKKDHPGSTEDLNRLMMDCGWDPKARRFVLRRGVR